MSFQDIDKKLIMFLQTICPESRVEISKDRAPLSSDHPCLNWIDTISIIEYQTNDKIVQKHWENEVGLITESPVIHTTNANVELRQMKFNQCHRNTSILLDNKEIDSIMTGFALSADCKWYYHSWGMLQGKIIETCTLRKVYCGYRRK